MIKVAIVEDESKDAESLKSIVLDYAEKKGEKFKVDLFRDGVDFIGDGAAMYDIVFLDIEMPVLNGIEAAKKLRKFDSDVCIIFITNMPQFAIKGYEVEALDYVLKPVSSFTICLKLDKALRLIKKRESAIFISTDSGTRRIPLSDICYMEVFGHMTAIHTEDEEIVTRASLKDLGKQLEGDWFFRCSRFYIINFRYLNGINGDNVLVADSSVKISRNKKAELLKKFAEYINRK